MARKDSHLRPLHIIDIAEMSTMICLVASLIYLISFFGIAYIQSVFSSHEDDDDFLLPSPAQLAPPVVPTPCPSSAPSKNQSQYRLSMLMMKGLSGIWQNIVIYTGIEAGDCRQAVMIRREALRRMTGRPMEGLSIEEFDYASILGQCCELPIGFVQLPVGIAGHWP